LQARNGFNKGLAGLEPATWGMSPCSSIGIRHALASPNTRRQNVAREKPVSGLRDSNPLGLAASANLLPPAFARFRSIPAAHHSLLAVTWRASAPSRQGVVET